MRTIERTLLLIAGSVMVGACSDPLAVENRNNPERANVLALPRDVEALGSRLYQNVHANTMGGSNDALYPQMLALSLENSSALNNFGMGPRGGIPRNFIDNTRGNSLQIGNRRDFAGLQQTARTAMVIKARLDEEGFTIGTEGADRRLRAFMWFGYGTALGNAALNYAEAAVPLDTDTETTVPPLQPYGEVMAAALAALDSAIAIAREPGTSFPIPGDWLAQSSGIPRDRFVQILHSYKARFRAGVARTPEERAAVNWAEVIADATNGIQTDFVLNLSPGAGWDYSWLVQMYTTGPANWHQMTTFMIGMADTSGAYDAHVRTARESRDRIVIATPDLRFPRGTTIEEQRTNSPDILTGVQYLRARPQGELQPSFAWGVSHYAHHRWRGLHAATRVGPWVTFSKVENDMLAAEGHIRAGAYASAATLINTSRARVGLPPVAASADAPVPGGTLATPVPGGASCVPRVPVPSTDPTQGYQGTRCGGILEAMKWEKRMETAYSSYGTWYHDGRGWGDLPEGTALQWPVPWQEMDARGVPFVEAYGGVGRDGGAPRSPTYGFGSGNQ